MRKFLDLLLHGLIHDQENFEKNLPELRKLSVLNECTSLVTRKKIISAGITFAEIVDIFERNSLEGLIKLFGKDNDGKLRVTDNTSIVKKIYNFLENLIQFLSCEQIVCEF